MPDKKITALTSLTSPDNSDVFPVVDVSANTTKKITWSNVKAALLTYLSSMIYTTVYNTVYVSDNGSDSTGLVQREDKPFLTLAAARTAALTLSPTSTKRILIVVLSGIYTEQLVLANYVDWDLGNSIIDLQAGALYTIDDLNVACDSIIYGNSKISRSTAGTLGCIRTQNASTNLRVYCDRITGSRATSAEILCTNGSQSIFVNDTVDSSSAGNVVQCTAGIQNVTILGKGNITSSDATGASITVYCTGGIQTIRGNIGHTGASGIALSRTGGTQYIYGNVATTTTTNDTVIFSSSGTTYIYGNLDSVSTGGALITVSGTGNLYIEGNVNPTAGASACQSSSTGIVSIKGNCNNSVSLTGAGYMYVYGNCTSSTADAVTCSAGNQFIYGNVSHTGGGSTAKNGASCTSTGNQHIYGNISCNDTNTAADGVTNSSSGTSIYEGNISCVGGHGFTFTGSGTVIIKSGSRIITTGTNMNSLQISAGTLILDGVTLIATGSGTSIYAGSALNVKIYGTCFANINKHTNITIQIGSLIVDSNVV